jgi:hypothetical protein
MPGDIAIRHLACLFHSAPSATGRVLQPIEYGRENSLRWVM